ncbi:MAG: dihydropteroate synthase [Gemmatimonadota bacterium]
MRRLRVERAADLDPFFERYGWSAGPAGAEDALVTHVLLRAPTDEEAVLLEEAAAPAEAGTRSVRLLRGPPRASPLVRGTLLSGEISSLRAFLSRLDRQPPAGVVLASEIRRALLPSEPAAWRLRRRELSLSRPLVMGIVNVTPDSFSDGGRFLETERALARGRELAEAGADLLDVGGESSRPGATRVERDEELRRAIPVVAGLAAEGLIVSIDTSRSEVARAALEAGAEVVNDVSAFGLDGGMAAVVGEAGAGAVLMHMRGTPATMQDRPWYQDVTGEVLERLGEALASAARAGVDPERCAVDPGIGFGKRLVDNEELLYRLSELKGLGRPLLVGPSRKGFLDPAKSVPPDERMPETLAAACLAALGGAHILRVHDVRECRRALDVVGRIREWGRGREPLEPPPTPAA